MADGDSRDPEEEATDPGSAWAERRKEKRSEPAAMPEWVTPRYRIVRQIGSGGFGVVYEAIDDRLQRRVAVKLLNKDDAEHSARLRTEALATARIHHRNIVGVTDFDALPDGTPFLVMEFAEGEDFRGLLERDTPFEVARAAGVARTLCAALSAAHEHGIVHRDLKPSNIVVGDPQKIEETLRICDFGLVKLLDSSESRLTQSGDFLGTPMYMAPEQVRQREDVDERADVYSVGTILYEMLTGSAPFAGRPVGDLLIAKATEKPRAPSELNDEVPRALDRVVLRAIRPEPGDRYQSAAQLSAVLEPFALGELPSPRLKRLAIAVAAVAGAALAALLLWNLRGGLDSDKAEPATEPAPARSRPSAAELPVAPEVPPAGGEVALPDIAPAAADAGPTAGDLPEEKEPRRRGKNKNGRPDSGSDLLFGP